MIVLKLKKNKNDSTWTNKLLNFILARGKLEYYFKFLFGTILWLREHGFFTD